MTTKQKIKKQILLNVIKKRRPNLVLPELTSENIDAIYREWENLEDTEDDITDCSEELRCSGINTDLPSPYSRHYEAQSVATKLFDGTWVGWVYWYGGGKHGQPEYFDDWMDSAYALDCIESEQMVIVRKFTKI